MAHVLPRSLGLTPYLCAVKGQGERGPKEGFMDCGLRFRQIGSPSTPRRLMKMGPGGRTRLPVPGISLPPPSGFANDYNGLNRWPCPGEPVNGHGFCFAIGGVARVDWPTVGAVGGCEAVVFFAFDDIGIA